MASTATDYVVLVAVFNNQADAEAAEGQLEVMAKEGLLELRDASVVYKDSDLKVHVNDLADEHKKGWGTGAVVGGVLGVIFPPTILASAAVGAGAGGIYHHFRDKGMKNSELEKAGENLTPGQYALIVAAKDNFVDQITSGLDSYATLGRYLLNADTGVLVSTS